MENQDTNFKVYTKFIVATSIIIVAIGLHFMQVQGVIIIVAALSVGAVQFILCGILRESIQTDFEDERRGFKNKIEAWRSEAESHNGEMMYFRDKYHELEKSVGNSTSLEDLRMLMSQDTGEECHGLKAGIIREAVALEKQRRGLKEDDDLLGHILDKRGEENSRRIDDELDETMKSIKI